MGEAKRRKDYQLTHGINPQIKKTDLKTIISNDLKTFQNQAITALAKNNNNCAIPLPVEQGLFFVDLALEQATQEIPKNAQQCVDLPIVIRDYKNIQSALFKSHANQAEIIPVFVVPTVALSMSGFALRFLARHTNESFRQFIHNRRAKMIAATS